MNKGNRSERDCNCACIIVLVCGSFMSFRTRVKNAARKEWEK